MTGKLEQDKYLFIHYRGDDNPEKRRRNKRKQEKAKARSPFVTRIDANRNS